MADASRRRLADINKRLGETRESVRQSHAVIASTQQFLRALESGAAPFPAPEPAAQSESRLHSRAVLIAGRGGDGRLDLGRIFREQGARVVEVSGIAQASAVLEEHLWVGAVLDETAGDATCGPLRDWLLERDIPHILYTEDETLACAPHGGDIATRPASAEALVDLLAQLADGDPAWELAL